jgi:hypothetical protein
MSEKKCYATNPPAKKLIYAIMVLLLGVSTATAQNRPDPLKSGFENPPAGARPRVWWHWMNGNITKDGIKLDLEWMHRVGLGGFQNFDAALATPQVVEKRLAYMTQEWKDAFKYATILADDPAEFHKLNKVINAWVNRLIGDQQPDATTKYTFADVTPYKADSPWLPSGLLGPVHVYSVAAP